MLQQEYRTNDAIERTVAPDLGIAARLLRDQGISTIPIKADGSKAPCITWKSYQEHLPADDDLTQWYDTGTPKGIAVIGGKVSGNLEVLDIDEPQLVERWKQVVEELRPGLVARLVQSETPSGGAHFFYRHDDEPTGNQKLAQDERLNGKGELSPYTLIETRGEGGYAIVPPSPASCHPDHKPYRYVQGVLGQVPTITADERHTLLDAARLFNSYVKPTRDYKASYQPLAVAGERPGDDYNAVGDWEELLTAHGWTVCYRKGEMVAWTRPDKGHGVSATTNHNGSNRLYVFSSNADPFDAETAYDLFGAYTLLEHDDDYAAAARDLAQQGYGHSRTVSMSEPDLNSSIYSNKSTAHAQEIEQDEQMETSWPIPIDLDMRTLPKLDDAALYGLAGDIVRAIEPHTEANNATVLINTLVFFGNAVNRIPHFNVGGNSHTVNLFAAIVGDTAKGRKGTSLGHVKALFKRVDEKWVEDRIQSGLSSGEGLIFHVRDASEQCNDDGKPNVPGVSDKRLLVIEEELAHTLKVMNRDNNTLSPTIRQAWDSGTLRILTRNNPIKATGAHISIIGHITSAELRMQLRETESANGFANRFLWVYSYRSKLLPHGGGIPDYDALASRLRDALTHAQEYECPMMRDEEANTLWEQRYGDLSEGENGLFGAVTGRAEAQVLRLSMVYALMDCSPIVRRTHLEAALALWQYNSDSAAYIFGHVNGNTRLEAARCLRVWIERKQLTTFSLSDVSEYTKGNKGLFPSDVERDAAIAELVAHHIIRELPTEQTHGRGHPPGPRYEVNPRICSSNSSNSSKSRPTSIVCDTLVSKQA